MARYPTERRGAHFWPTAMRCTSSVKGIPCLESTGSCRSGMPIWMLKKLHRAGAARRALPKTRVRRPPHEEIEMKKSSAGWKRPRRQSGYALLLVVFLTLLLTLSTIIAAPSTRTERQREKEEEMIWRGKQYIRGIKLYYRKNGRFPTSVDDLIKPKVG